MKILKRKTDENHDFSGGFSRIVVGRLFHYGTKSIEKPEELTSIKHVCIIQNAKVRPHDLDRALSKALAKRGIGSTIVTADNRGKLYDSSCPYNLRYKTKGNNEILRKGVFVLRSTKYAVSTVSYSLNDENHFRTNPDLVKQAEGVVAKLLEKNSK